jgi:hypothetical protein
MAVLPIVCEEFLALDLREPRSSSPFRKRIGGFWRLSQRERSDLFDRLGEGELFAGSVVEFGGDPVEVDGAVD